MLVYFDPDLDGLVSGLFYVQFLRKHGLKFRVYVNPNREHGFRLPQDRLESYRGYSFLSGDFAVSHETIRMLVEDFGISYLATDHHTSPDDFGEFRSPSNGAVGVFISNHNSGEPTEHHFQSGAGVVFDVLTHFDSSLDTRENRALVGMTLLSDVRDIENPLAKPFLDTLYSYDYNTEDRFIKYLIQEITKHNPSFGFGVPVMDRNFIDFKVSPGINSLFRWGREQDALKFILGYGLPERNFHGDQKELVNLMQTFAVVHEYSHVNIVEVDLGTQELQQYSDVIPAFVGVLASKYVKDRSAVCYALGLDGEIVRASFRGYHPVGNYLSVLNRRSSKVKLAGHEVAAGVQNLEVDFDDFQIINDACAEVDSSSTHTPQTFVVDNLAKVRDQLDKIAYINSYRLRPNFIGVKYVGSGVREEVVKETYQRYRVDGLRVTSFDQSLTFSDGVIYPEVDKRSTVLYLKDVGGN